MSIFSRTKLDPETFQGRSHYEVTIEPSGTVTVYHTYEKLQYDRRNKKYNVVDDQDRIFSTYDKATHEEAEAKARQAIADHKAKLAAHAAREQAAKDNTKKFVVK